MPHLNSEKKDNVYYKNNISESENKNLCILDNNYSSKFFGTCLIQEDNNITKGFYNTYLREIWGI